MTVRTRSDGRSKAQSTLVGQFGCVVSAVVLAASLLGVGVAGGVVDDGTGPQTSQLADQAGPTEIESCTVIDEPGRYELTADVESDGGACVHVRSDDVVLDGNGHTVGGTGNSSDDSVGVLAFNGSENGFDRRGDPLENVTVLDLTVTGHGHGVRLGQIVGSGPTVTVRNVTATDNGDGVVAFGVGGSSLVDLAATGNERTGVIVWETTFLSVRNLTVSDNGANGLALDQSVLASNVTGVTATDNGGRGIVVDAGSVGNVVTDAYVADNGGTGVEFSDSSGTTLRNATVADNGGPGISSEFGEADRVENVTLADNAVAYDSSDDSSRYGIVTDELRLANGVVASFGTSVTGLDDADEVPDPPDGVTVAGPAVNLSVGGGDGEPRATVAFPVEADAAENGAELTVRRYANGTWHEVSDVTVDEGERTVTVTVRRGGIVVPVATDGTLGNGSTSAVNATGDGEPVTDLPADEAK